VSQTRDRRSLNSLTLTLVPRRVTSTVLDQRREPLSESIDRLADRQAQLIQHESNFALTIDPDVGESDQGVVGCFEHRGFGELVESVMSGNIDDGGSFGFSGAEKEGGLRVLG
jgi:hypothetical protein